MIEVVKLSPEEWRGVAEDTFKVVFDELRPASLDRIDYALVACDERGPLGYLTARELDADGVYWQYGGGFPTTRESLHALRTYQAFVSWTKGRYKRVTTLVENTNVRYLKMAMSQGFRVIGVRLFGGSVLCELLLDFEKGE